MSTNSHWLHVIINEDQPLPRLTTLPSLITLSDIKCDNYVRLIAADIAIDDNITAAKLKVFRGIDLESQHDLKGIPAAIESLYIDESEPKTPILAVAINESILFYRHLKPYFKYTLPELPIVDEEHDIWNKLIRVPEDDQGILIESLNSLDRWKLCRKSQQLLQLPEEERKKFIRKHRETPLIRYANIVALKCLARVSSGQNHTPSYLLIATDIGEILILEPQSFNILYRALPCPNTAPSILAVHGTYETDFCIVVATRYGGAFLIRKTSDEAQEIFKLSQPAISLVLLPIDQTIVVITMEQTLVCYSKKGKQLYMIPLAAPPTCMTSINLSHLGITVICVAMNNGVVQFYMQKYLVDEFKVEGIVSSLTFGRMGLEEHVLCLSTIEGNLILKILKRTATFEPQQNKGKLLYNMKQELISADALEKPKKSSIFVEQIAREQQNAKTAYSNFQVELWHLRHVAARATVDALNASERIISNDITQAPVQLSAEVCGVGPIFRIFLTLQNLSTYKMASNLTVLLHSDRRHYTITKSMAKLPSILPGVPLKIDFEVMAVLDSNNKLPPYTLTLENSHIRVLLLKSQQTKPLIATIIAMPQSEMSAF